MGFQNCDLRCFKLVSGLIAPSPVLCLLFNLMSSTYSFSTSCSKLEDVLLKFWEIFDENSCSDIEDLLKLWEVLDKSCSELGDFLSKFWEMFDESCSEVEDLFLKYPEMVDDSL